MTLQRHARVLFSSLLILSILTVFGNPKLVSAHRDGCHRWHSCPSDTGSYVCGDLGYTSGCPTTQAAQQVVIPSTPKPTPKPTLKPSIKPKVTPTPTSTAKPTSIPVPTLPPSIAPSSSPSVTPIPNQISRTEAKGFWSWLIHLFN